MESASSWSNLCASTSVLQQPFPHAVVSSSRGCWCERSQKARKPGRANTVEANSGSLFKQMFMNIFCHICRVLIVIWLDGHMSLKVEDWIYRGRGWAGTWPTEQGSGEWGFASTSAQAWASHLGRLLVTWPYCSLPFLGKHTHVVSRTAALRVHS